MSIPIQFIIAQPNKQKCKENRCCEVSFKKEIIKRGSHPFFKVHFSSFSVESDVDFSPNMERVKIKVRKNLIFNCDINDNGKMNRTKHENKYVK